MDSKAGQAEALGTDYVLLESTDSETELITPHAGRAGHAGEAYSSSAQRLVGSEPRDQGRAARGGQPPIAWQQGLWRVPEQQSGAGQPAAAAVGGGPAAAIALEDSSGEEGLSTKRLRARGPALVLSSDDEEPLALQTSQRAAGPVGAATEAAEWRDMFPAKAAAVQGQALLSGGAKGLEEAGGSRSTAGPAAGAQHDLAGQPRDAALVGGGGDLLPGAGAARGHSSSSAGQGGRKRSKSAAAWVVNSSSSEDELPSPAPSPDEQDRGPAGIAAVDGSGGGGSKRRSPARKRLRKGARDGVGSAGAVAAGAAIAAAEVAEAVGKGSAASPAVAAMDTTPGVSKAAPQGGGSRPARRAAQRTGHASQSLSAAERIRRAQQQWQLGGLASAGEGDSDSPRHSHSSGSDGGGNGGAGSSVGEESGSESEGEPPGIDGLEGAGRSRARAAAAVANQAGGQPAAKRSRKQKCDWQAAASALGLLGGFSDKDLFTIYVEYQLMCLIDPGYAETVRASPQHRDYYERAARRVEQDLELKRGAVASAAWKSGARGLVEALESLPGISTGWADEDDEGSTCAACNRCRSRATRLLVLKGCPLSGSSKALPGTLEEDAEGCEDEGGTRRIEFPVGRFCCARLMLYHALFHWRHRLLARLRREVKCELRRRKRQGQSRERQHIADALLQRDSLLADLHRNYRTLLDLSEKYQLSGGEESSRGAWEAEFEGVHAGVAAALCELHSCSEGEESDVQWPDEQESDSESDSQASLGQGLRLVGGRTAARPGRQRASAAWGGVRTGHASADRLLDWLRGAAQAPAAGAAAARAAQAQGLGAAAAGAAQAPAVGAAAAGADAGEAEQAPAPQGGLPQWEDPRPVCPPQTPAGHVAAAPWVRPEGSALVVPRKAASQGSRRWLSEEVLLVRSPAAELSTSAGATPAQLGVFKPDAGVSSLEVAVRVKGTGTGREAALRGLRDAGGGSSRSHPLSFFSVSRSQQKAQVQAHPQPSPPLREQQQQEQQMQASLMPQEVTDRGKAPSRAAGASSLKQVGIRSFFGVLAPPPMGKQPSAAGAARGGQRKRGLGDAFSKAASP